MTESVELMACSDNGLFKRSKTIKLAAAAKRNRFWLIFVYSHLGLQQNARRNMAITLDQTTTNRKSSIHFVVVCQGFVHSVELVAYKGKFKRARYHGITYVSHKIHKHHKYWRCLHWTSQCPARFITRSINGCEFTKKPNDQINHNHHHCGQH